MHVRVFLKKCIEQFFLVYQEYFVWIVKNAFNGDKILANYVPSHIKLSVDKESGRKKIKMGLVHSINTKSLLKRDIEFFEEFLKIYPDFLSDTLIEALRISSKYIFRRLFDNSYSPAAKPAVRELDFAIEHLKKNMKNGWSLEPYQST